MVEEATVSVINDVGDVTVVGSGILTYMNATEFGEALRKASITGDSVKVDLRGAEFIDTQIVQDLGQAAVKLLSREKRLKVILSATGYPLKVMEISGYEAIMDIVVEAGDS